MSFAFTQSVLAAMSIASLGGTGSRRVPRPGGPAAAAATPVDPQQLRLIKTVGSKGSTLGQFQGPRHMAAMPDGGAAIVDGLKRSVTAGTAEQLSADKVSELLLITQYFETLKDIGANSKATSVFIPHSPGEGVRDISSQIRNGIMQGGAAPGQVRM